MTVSRMILIFILLGFAVALWISYQAFKEEAKVEELQRYNEVINERLRPELLLKTISTDEWQKATILDTSSKSSR